MQLLFRAFIQAKGSFCHVYGWDKVERLLTDLATQGPVLIWG